MAPINLWLLLEQPFIFHLWYEECIWITQLLEQHIASCLSCLIWPSTPHSFS
jgi:hypothetical protein